MMNNAIEIHGEMKRELTLSEVIANYGIYGVRGNGKGYISTNNPAGPIYPGTFNVNNDDIPDYGAYQLTSGRNVKTNFGAWCEVYRKYREYLHLKDGFAECIFYGQLLFESGGFKYMSELGNQAQFAKYDFRTDLGNNGVGMGYRYRGRGPIQCTGKSNYERIYNEFFKSIGLNSVDIVNHPELADDPKISSLMTIGWCLTTPNGQKFISACNRDNGLTDAADIVREATKAVNGGTTGFDKRFSITKSLLGHLKESGTVTISV